MNMEERFQAVDADIAKAALQEFLQKFNSPAFGSIPKREIELAVFELMRQLNLIEGKASLYQLMTELRVTRTKAAQLLFDLDVRQIGGNQEELDKAVKQAIAEAKFAKDGDYFVLEIENPLVIAHLRDMIRQLGHVSDTSFNSALVRMPLDAATDLITDFIPDESHEGIKQALIAAGAPDGSVKGIIKSSLKTLGSKVLGAAAKDIADDLVENTEKFLTPLLEGAGDQITKVWAALWEENG